MLKINIGKMKIDGKIRLNDFGMQVKKKISFGMANKRAKNFNSKLFMNSSFGNIVFHLNGLC